MSASSHSRDHRYAAELTAAVLAWLAGHGRRVVNGPRALDLEISKARQYAALEAAGIGTPRTILVAGKDQLLAAARRHFDAGPVILKPNRGGKGLGVRLFHTADALVDHLASPRLRPAGRRPAPVAAIRAGAGAGDHSRRVHRGQIHVCGRGDTSDGFELCPADVCAVGDAFCPAGDEPRAKFTIIDDIDAGLNAATRISSPKTTSRSPGSSSSPILPARSTHTMSIPIPTTIPTPKPAPAVPE